MGAFSLIFGLLGLGAAGLMGVPENMRYAEINRVYQEDLATHNYNLELQRKYEWTPTIELMGLLGISNIGTYMTLGEYFEDRYGRGGCWKEHMVKELMEKAGYDYHPKYDTASHNAGVRLGMKGYNSYKGTYKEGL